MKRILLTVSCLFSLNFLQAQLVEIGNATNQVTGTLSNPDDTELSITDWEIINGSSETIAFGCKKIGVSEVPGSTNQFCWGILCSAFGQGNLTSSQVVTLAPGAYSSTFYAHYRHNDNPGQSIIRYCWFDTNNTSNEFCYDVNFCVDGECIVGVRENTAVGEISNISPNPINGTGNISYSFLSPPSSGKLSIYNMMGELVKQVSLTKKNGTVMINAVDFVSGIYFCNIENEGKIFETKRLVISK